MSDEKQTPAGIILAIAAVVAVIVYAVSSGGDKDQQANNPEAPAKPKQQENPAEPQKPDFFQETVEFEGTPSTLTLVFEFEDRSEPTKTYKPELFCLKFYNGSSEGRQIEIRKSGGGSTYCIDGKNLDALEVREEIPQSKGKHKLKISFQNEILSVELDDKYMARGSINGGKAFMPTKLEISYDTADYSHSLKVIEQDSDKKDTTKQPQSSSALFPNNLVAFFPFKDKSDQVRLKKSEHINDLSGKKNDLAIHYDDIVSKGDGLLIDNLAQGQEASSALIKEIKTDVSDKASVSCWIKVEEKAQFRPLKLGRAGDSVHSVLMLYFKPGPNVPNQQGVEIILLGNKGSSIRTPYKTYNIRIGEWHHYVMVDNAEKVQLYIDGILFNEVQISDVEKQLNLDYPYLTLGCNPFKGAIREVAVYDIALNPEQVKALYGSIR